MALNFKVEFKGLKELEEAINPKTFVRIITRTFNKLGDQIKSTVSKKIRETYNIKKDRLDSAMKITKASYTNPVYSINTKEKAPGLQHYTPRQAGKGKSRKVTVLVRKDKGRKVVKKGFMAPTPTGQIAIWKRTGEAKRTPSKGRYAGTKTKREPIKRLLGPDAVAMMKQVGIEEVQKVIDEKADKIWTAQVNYELGKKK